MARVKRAVGAKKKRRKIFKLAKGYMWGRSKRYRTAKDAVKHALVHAYVDRRKKKRNARRLWNLQINAATRELGMTYSRFIEGLTKKKVGLDRKVLSQLAQMQPQAFKEIVEMARK
ncbi:MAG: 50S ribosomal protein L20 [Candidatus Portnoybacteria bacterium]|nr:50S ribosomal protein L20 [Candidatus Portnoybacteria bacterium]MDD4982664.1 50S ribosomal protein L20 [Candidatus Portnoybacteria bacterium]